LYRISNSSLFFFAYQRYFNSPFYKDVAKKKKALIKEQKKLNKKLEKELKI